MSEEIKNEEVIEQVDAIETEATEEEKAHAARGKILKDRQRETAGAAAIEVLKLFGTQENLFMLSDSDEEKEKYDEAYQNMLGDILMIFEKHKVAIADYDYIFGGIEAVVSSLKNVTKNHATNLRTEIESRFIGARDPVGNRYNVQFATHQDLIDATFNIREKQGNDMNEYFFVGDGNGGE